MDDHGMEGDGLRPDGATDAVRFDEGGLWAVRSTSNTVYYLDFDKAQLLRVPGVRSARGPYDDVWVQLRSIYAAEEDDVVRVGRRHRYDTDPNPGGIDDERWWLQRVVTSIERVDPSDRPEGRGRDPDESCRRYTHHWQRTATTTPEAAAEDPFDDDF